MDARTAVVALDNREKDCKRAFYIPIWALEVTNNDFQTAMFLKQVVFWSQRTDNPDGFYKTYDEWIEESRLNRYRVEKAVKIMNAIAGVELITVTNKKVNGTPKLHYRLNWEALYSLICERCASLFADVEQIRFAEGAQMDLSTSAQIQYKESDRDIQTEKQTEITDSSFSSDQLQPAPVEEKEKTILHFPVFEDELISKLAYVLGYSLQGSPKLVKETKVTLAGIARELRTIDPAVKANDLTRYLEYYHLQAPSRPRPAVRYVLKGWQGYKDWLGGQAPTYDDTEIGGTIQVGDEWVYVFALPKDWQAIENGVPSGWVLDCISDETRQRVHYTQQPDGTFALTEIQQAS